MFLLIYLFVTPDEKILGSNFLKKFFTLLLTVILKFILIEKFFTNLYKKIAVLNLLMKLQRDKKLIHLQIISKKRIPIIIIFKIIGADAAANLLWELSIPAKKEDKLTNIKKGNVILVKSVAILIFSLSSTNPGAIIPTTIGMKISATKTKISNAKNNKLKISFAKIFDFFFPLANSVV